MAAKRFGFLLGHPAELRHAIRVAIAVIVAFVAVKLLNMPQGFWAVITALLVVQTSVGGSFKAALDRLLGTVAGAFYGALVAIAVPHANSPGLGLAIVIAILPLAYLAAVNAAFRVAPVTALIVLLPMYAHSATPWISAIDRVVEIVIGNISALAVTLVVLPPRAHGQLREAAATVLSLNADLMDALMEGLLGDKGRQGVQPLHASIRAGIKKVETAAEEASRERRMRIGDAIDPEPLVRTLYRLRHDLVMIGRASVKPLPVEVKPKLSPSLSEVRQEVTTLLRGMSAVILVRAAVPSPDAAFAAIRMFSTALESNAAALPPDEAGRLYALRFSLEQLGEDLRDLSARIGEHATPSMASATGAVR